MYGEVGYLRGGESGIDFQIVEVVVDALLICEEIYSLLFATSHLEFHIVVAHISVFTEGEHFVVLHGLIVLMEDYDTESAYLLVLRVHTFEEVVLVGDGDYT